MVASVAPAVTPQEEGAALIMGSQNLKDRPRGIMMIPQEQNPLSMADGWAKKAEALAKPDLLVVSYGGVGTTAFFNELNALGLPLQMNDAEDGDGLMHLPWQRLVNERFSQMNNVNKILYLYTSPQQAAVSHFRRGWAWAEACKTRKDRLGSNADVENFWEHFPHTLLEYANAGEDAFELEAHFDSYKKGAAESWPGQIAFLDVTKTVEHVEELADFLNISSIRLANQLSSWNTTNAAELLAERDALLFWRPKTNNQSETVGEAAKFDLIKMLGREPTKEEYDAALARYTSLNHPGITHSPAASRAVEPHEFYKLTKAIQVELKQGKEQTTLAALKTSKKFMQTMALASNKTLSDKTELETAAHILSYLDNKFVSLLIKQNTVGVNGFNQSLSTPGWERGRTWAPRPEEERLANLEKKHKRMEKLGLIKPVAVGAF
jgi:hypothetical protein